MDGSHREGSEDVAAQIARVRAGDIDAYAGIVRAHQAEVFRVVAFALRDLDGSADLVQQAFVDAFVALDRFEDGRDFGAWVRGIARNLVRQELRRRGREGRRYSAYREHLEVVASVEQGDAREEALRAALGRCRDKLAEPAQRALALRYEQGHAFEDVARALDRTVAASRQLLQRVRLSLRACIEREMAS